MSSLQHAGFIMDGNRRWARKNRLQILLGHESGVKRIEPLVEHAAKKGIQYLTFWAFSTENWRRTEEEVKTLMYVFRQALKDPMMDRLKKNGVRVNVIGDLSQFPKDIQKSVSDIVVGTKGNKRITANFALNYGGRDEILWAVNRMLEEGLKNTTEEQFGNYLYTAGQPDPDLIIRTGGEDRLSGFLTWQSVYSELYFTDVLWPDFDISEFDKAIGEYEKRERRFGK